jgi:uncharacterized protein (DUF488 family)
MPIFTIGHGTRPIAELLDLLDKFAIGYLADVRSQPYSKFNPQYNRESLHRSLNQQNIKYIYLGDSLGGRPQDPSCYNNLTGRIDYDLVRQKDFFKKGIERLISAHEKNLNVALMCSERKPELCHRSKLISQTLHEKGIPVHHIDETGEQRTHDDITALWAAMMTAITTLPVQLALL